MAAVDAIHIPALECRELLGFEFYFLDAVSAGRCRPLLITYQLTGRLISLGRYHLYDGPQERAGIGVYRRPTGGRIAGAGEGWLGCALILPTRDALLPTKLAGVRPEQVMNRYVRGILAGLGRFGLDCSYPGRDAITCQQRELAVCSFETNPSGALLFETLLAVDRGLEAVVFDLERLDPDGSLTVPMYSPETATTMARELGHDVATAELAGAIEHGYATLLGGVRPRELTPDERVEAERHAEAAALGQWLRARRPEPELDQVGRERGQLGFVEAHLALDGGGKIERLMMAGDFIANSSGVAEFEHALAGQRLDPMTVSAAAAKTFATGVSYILGLGDLANLVKVIMKAA